MNAAAITAIRTAAVSAVATRLLARPDAAVLAILGAGVQAKTHLRAIPLVRPIREVRVFSRSGARSIAEASSGMRVRRVPTAEEAVRGADVIVTATSSREPVLAREWIAPGRTSTPSGPASPRPASWTAPRWPVHRSSSIAGNRP